MFASFARYKREAYRHSEFAPKILNDAGLKVVMRGGPDGVQFQLPTWFVRERRVQQIISMKPILDL